MKELIEKSKTERTVEFSIIPEDQNPKWTDYC